MGSHGSESLDLYGFSALGELRRTTGSLQAVLLALLHTRIAGEEASLLQGSAQFGVSLAQGAADGTVEGYYELQKKNFIAGGEVQGDPAVADYVMLDVMAEAGSY